jgi:hypothetical protein
MVQTVFDKVLGKARSEVELLTLVGVSSLVLSSFLLVDAALALRVEQYGLTLIVLRAGELIFAGIWLHLTGRFIQDINKLRKKYFKTFYLWKLQRLDEEKKKSEATELVRDMVAFYRENYVKVKATLSFAIGIGLLVITAVIYLLSYGYISFWEAIFRWMLQSLMLLVAAVLYLHIHRNWGRKLLKVQDSEKKFQEILGGPIET